MTDLSEGLQKKPFEVRVQVVSVSNGVENQELTLVEGASEEAELTLKCFTVVEGITNAMESLAEAGGFPTGLGRGKKRG